MVNEGILHTSRRYKKREHGRLESVTRRSENSVLGKYGLSVGVLDFVTPLHFGLLLRIYTIAHFMLTVFPLSSSVQP